MNNKTWDRFIGWMKKEKGIDIGLSKKDLWYVVREYEDNKGTDKDVLGLKEELEKEMERRN
jgi:hypothetical protein